MTRARNRCLALLAVLLSPTAANATPITINFEIDTADSTFGSFTFDSSLDGTTLSYADLDTFSITLWSGSAYDLTFVNSGNFSDWLGFAFDTVNDSFINAAMPSGIFAAIEADFQSGFWVGNFYGGLVADYPGAPFQSFTSISTVRSTTVSEPGTLALFGIGRAAIGLCRRRNEG